jgi:hypothetical protein
MNIRRYGENIRRQAEPRCRAVAEISPESRLLVRGRSAAVSGAVFSNLTIKGCGCPTSLDMIAIFSIGCIFETKPSQ